ESADTCRGPYGIAHPGNGHLNPSAQALKVSIPVSASVVLPTDGFQRLTTKSQVKCRDLSSDRFHQMVIQSARKLMQGTIDTHFFANAMTCNLNSDMLYCTVYALVITM